MSRINPDPIGQPSFRPQHPPRLEDLKRIARQAGAMTHSQATGGFNDAGSGSGLQLGEELMPEGFWARLTAIPPSDSVPFYSFTEVQDDGTGAGWTPPNGALVGVENASEINGNLDVPVPGAPIGLSASLDAGGALSSNFYSYVVTARWLDNATGLELQSDLSNEVAIDPAGGDNTVVLNWTAPNSVSGFTLLGYDVWRGTVAGGENVLLASLGTTTTFTDDGSAAGTDQEPIQGGTAGPIVWMYTRSAWNFYKFAWTNSSVSLPLAWVQVTSSALTTITLPLSGGVSNGTVSGYLGRLESWSGTVTLGPLWTIGGTVWFYPVNNELPEAGFRYQCRLLGSDKYGMGIWGSAFSDANLAFVRLNSIPDTPPVVTLPSGATVNAYAGTFSGGDCWLLADIDGHFTVSPYPGSGGVWQPPLGGWTYQARLTGIDAGGVPIFSIASWHDANLINSGGGAVTAYAGLVNVGNQTFLGSKGIAGSLTVGGWWFGGSYGTGGNATVWGTVYANGPPDPVAAIGYTVVSAGAVHVGDGFDAPGSTAGAGTITTIANSTGNAATGVLVDTAFFQFSLDAGGTGSATFGIGTEDFYFNGLAPPNVGQPGIYIGASGALTECATGTDPVGNVFVSGLCAVIGGTEGTGTITTFVDDGSFWPA